MRKTKNQETLPIIGRIYNAYFDGRLEACQQNKVFVTRVVKYNDAPKPLKEVWKMNIKTFPDVFMGKTSHFIFGEMITVDYNEYTGEKEYNNVTVIFARTLENIWFGISSTGILTFWYMCYGAYALDVDGRLTRKAKRDCKDEEFYEAVSYEFARQYAKKHQLLKKNNYGDFFKSN